MKPSRDISGLLEIMAALRTPQTGCPWDLEQNFTTIAPYTIEEAYEVADAIARGDLADLRDEFGDVVEAITEKLLRRHPHVFGDADARRPEAVKGLWERIKAEERASKASQKGTAAPDGALAGVPAALPAMIRA